MDDKMFMDYLMQQNLTMMQMLSSMMVQPQPNPMAQMRIPQAPSPQQIMMQSNAAVTPNLIQVQDLQAEIAALKQQLMDAQAQLTSMQGQLASANERASAAEAKVNAAEAQAAQIQAQYDKLARDVSIVEVSQGRPLQEIVEESQLMTGDDYYDRNREEYQNMDGQEAHQLIQDKMDAKDEWIKQHSTEEEYKAFRSKLHEREKEQYEEQNGIVNFSKNMVDAPKPAKKKPNTDKDNNF